MSLSSLIVQRGVATMRQVEEALARQVIYGGDLVTNLLEVARLEEAVLARLLAESSRLAPAPPGELPRAPDHALALVPAAMAAHRAIVPLDTRGNTLILAVAERLPPDVQEQLSFALGMGIEQRTAPSVRVRQAIANAYGLPLERRMLRLLARLSGKQEDMGSTPPPLEVVPQVPEPPRPPSDRPLRTARPVAPPLRVAVASMTGSGAPPLPGRRKTSTSFPAGRAAAAPQSSTPSASGVAEQGAAPSLAPAEVDRSEKLLQREVAPSTRPPRRRRGPLTLEAAAHEAEHASDRDGLLELFFDYSRQFFDYAALFIVHGDIAEGRDAFGRGAPRERVLGIGVPLDLPSMMSQARDARKPILAKASTEGLDAVLVTDLQRASDAEIAVIPLLVRTRAVAMLTCDGGDGGTDWASVKQVVAFGDIIAKAFERIIVRRKLEGFVPGTRGSSVGRVDASGVAAKRGPVSLPEGVTAALRSAFLSTASSMPPPPANIVAVRKISGPPIPREEPSSPIDMRAVRAAAVTEPPPAGPPKKSAPGSSARATSHENDEDNTKALFDELGWESPRDGGTGPPPSSAIAVPPHRPPLPSGPAPERLPSVIVEIDLDLVAIVDRVIAGEADEAAEAELLRQGERAMQAIMSRFPGPVTFERARIAALPYAPRASECGPILRLIAHERRVALPFVLERLASRDPETRGWATHLICELPYVEAIPHLLPRLQDPDASTRASAARAFAAIARTNHDEVRRELVGQAHAVDPEQRAAAMPVIAELRDPSLVPELIHGLGDGYERVLVAANVALVKLTRQDFGEDARRWLRWWDQNAARHRVEWLIDALTHDVSEIRRVAGEELRALSKEYFGYSSDLPARDRERAQQRYRDWWITEGRARFQARD